MTNIPLGDNRAKVTSERGDLNRLANDPLTDSVSSDILVAERLCTFEERYQRLLNQTDRYVHELGNAGYLSKNSINIISEALKQKTLASALSTLCSIFKEKSGSDTAATFAKLSDLQVAASDVKDFAGKISNKIDPKTGALEENGFSPALLKRSIELRLDELEEGLITSLNTIVSELPEPRSADKIQTTLLKLTKRAESNKLTTATAPAKPKIPLEALLSTESQQSTIAPSNYYGTSLNILKGQITQIAATEEPHRTLAMEELLLPTDGIGGHTDLSAIVKATEPQIVPQSAILSPNHTTIHYRRNSYSDMEHIPFPLGYSPHQYRFLDKNGAPLATSGQLLAHQYGFGIAEWPENAQALEVCFSDGSLYRPRQEELVTICQYGGQHGSLLITDELRELPILTRLDAVVSSYKKRELIYNKERVIGELIQASGEHMYPFFEGLGVGDCKLLSYQLASTLNALNIPAVIARGQVADGLSRKQYITPGHRHVIAYAPHPIKLDPTLWCKYAFTIDPHHQALNATAEKLSQVGSPEEAYQLGKDLRRLIVVKGTPVNRSESNNGHLLNDDSDKVLTHPNENDGFYIYSPQELTHLHRKVSAKVKRLINAVSETYTYECGKFIDQLYGKHESYPVQCLKAYLQKRTDVPPRVLESGQLLYDTAQYYCLHCHNEESTDHIFERIIESQFSDCVVDTERDYQLIESYVHWQEGHQPEAIYGGLECIIQLAAIRPHEHPALYKRVLTNYFQSLSFDLNDNSHHREEILLSLLEPNKILSSIIASTPDVVADEIQEIIMDFLQRETTIKELTGFGLYRGDTIETWIEFLRWNAERPEYQHLFDEDKKFSDAMCDIIRYGFFTIASHRSTQTWPTDTQRLTSTFNNLLTFEERVERKISLITTAEDKEDFATIYRRSMEHTPHHLSLYSEPTAKIALTLAGLTHEISLHYSGELVLLLAQERGAIDHATMMELWKEYRHPVEHPEDTKKSATDLMIFSLRQLIDTFYTSLPRLPITPASNELCYALVSAEREFIQNEDPALELFGNKDFGYVIDHSELSNYESDVISDFSHIYWTTDHKSLSTIRERALKGALAHIRSQLGPPKIIDTVRYLHAMLDTEEISETKITSKLQLFLESERRWTRHYDDAITLYEGITRSYPEPSNILFLDGNRRDIKLDPKDGGTLLSKLFSLIHTLRSPARFDANILEQKLLNNPPSQLKVHAIAKELNSDGIPQKRPGNGQEYLENRPYQQGDDVRHIDWRAFAKTDKYHTMVRTDESPQLASNNLHIQVDAASIPCHCDTPSQSLLTLMNYIYAGVRAGKEVNVTLYHEGTIIVDVRHTAVQELTSSKGSHSLLEFMHDFGHAVNSFTRDIREKFPHYKKLPFLNPPKSHSPSVRRDPRLQEAQPVLACTNKALERLREKGKNLKNHLFLRLPEEDVYTPTLSQLIDNIEEVEGLALEELKELIKGDRELHEKHSTEEISS